MVEIFFHLASKWSKWCAQTLHPFSQILTISSRIGARIVAPPSDNFQNCSTVWKGLFFRKKRYKQRLNGLQMPTLCLVEVTQLRTKAVDGRRALFSKIKSEKHHISSSRADVRRVISTKFCMVVEVVRAIISGPIRFWVPSIVSPLGVVENLTENAPIAVNC